ncbi:MAG: hypothetical protein JNL98_05635 [Bryobacterales bacterium]|nr:hypothetical protein [Bryobacterales bacterium]
MSTPETVICTFRVIPGKLDDFRKLLTLHWPVLHKLGLIEDSPHLALEGIDKGVEGDVVEIFAWKSREAVEIAHQSPEVLAIWEPMGMLCEARNGKPPMEFPHYRPA